MAINSKDLLQNGEFITRFTSGINSIPSGSATGDLVVVTPPSGMRVRLTYLVSSDSTNDNISVALGSAKAIDQLSIRDHAIRSTPGYTLGALGDDVNSGGPMEAQGITGKVDEVMTISNDDPSPTASFLYYSYQLGE